MKSLIRNILEFLAIALIVLIVMNLLEIPWVPAPVDAQASEEEILWKAVDIVVKGVAIIIAYVAYRNNKKTGKIKCDECNKSISAEQDHVTICDGCGELYQNAKCDSSDSDEIAKHKKTTCSKCNTEYRKCGTIDDGEPGSLHKWHQDGKCKSSESEDDEECGNEEEDDEECGNEEEDDEECGNEEEDDES
ncbi:hypothetical protein F4083_04635 [Candidatus Poribacteria bacterium]|nr:hypothetical protein [Candidatus Poribacteria bacterium]MYI93597.1 hypothetical protein [Candidatus Poribacteria bacterium]